jgi:hypothetical protein
MPRGPKGQKRPADVVGNAVHGMRIATGQIEDTTTEDGKNAGAAHSPGNALGLVRNGGWLICSRRDVFHGHHPPLV